MCAMAIVAGRADLDGAAEVGFDIELPVFSVGAAGELANVHPQTLRQYDRLGLVVPQRTEGGARRYSLRDISRLAQAQQLSQEEGINLAGITRIFADSPFADFPEKRWKTLKKSKKTVKSGIYRGGMPDFGMQLLITPHLSRNDVSIVRNNITYSS